MVLAGVHITVGYFLGEILSWQLKWRVYALSYLAAFAALVPDFDFLLVILFGDMGLHRSFTNHFWIPALIALFGFVFWKSYKWESFAIALGYASHVALDLISMDAGLLFFAMLDGIALTLLIVYHLIKEWRRQNA